MTANQRPTWLPLATTSIVVQRAALTALIVGCQLTAINHSAALLHGDLAGASAFQITLTAIAPYVVSTTSSVMALRDIHRVDEEQSVTRT